MGRWRRPKAAAGATPTPPGAAAAAAQASRAPQQPQRPRCCCFGGAYALLLLLLAFPGEAGAALLYDACFWVRSEHLDDVQRMAATLNPLTIVQVEQQPARDSEPFIEKITLGVSGAVKVCLISPACQAQTLAIADS